jgi:hypothetical protein
MIEHAIKADKDISKDFFIASSGKQLSYNLMIEKGVIPELYKPFCQPRFRSASGHIYPLLPGFQRRDEEWSRIEAREKQRVAEEELNKKKTLQAQWDRFIMSIGGGLALIAPMLLMALQHSRTTALAATSGAVLLFAVIIAKFTTATPEVAVGAVAAYAAVLVVFVGSTLPPAT